VNSTSSNDDGINRRPQQTHDEAVCWIKTTDGRAASIVLGLEADHSIESANEISDRPLSGTGWKMQSPIIQVSEPYGQCWAFVLLVTLDECPYKIHLTAMPRLQERPCTDPPIREALR